MKKDIIESISNPRILWQKLHSLATEKGLGIRTTGMADPITEGGVHYTPLPYNVIFRILEHLKLGPKDVFIDIGCGKGRVICCAGVSEASKVVGIEINEKLVAIARENIQNLRKKHCPIELFSRLAEEYSYSDATVIYLYNPFDERILRKVLSIIDAAMKANPRPLRIVYANPLHERAIADLGWMERYLEWPASDFPGFACPISFWRSK